MPATVGQTIHSPPPLEPLWPESRGLILMAECLKLSDAQQSESPPQQQACFACSFLASFARRTGRPGSSRSSNQTVMQTVLSHECCTCKHSSCVTCLAHRHRVRPCAHKAEARTQSRFSHHAPCTCFTAAEATPGVSGNRECNACVAQHTGPCVTYPPDLICGLKKRDPDWCVAHAQHAHTLHTHILAPTPGRP